MFAGDGIAGVLAIVEAASFRPRASNSLVFGTTDETEVFAISIIARCAG